MSDDGIDETDPPVPAHAVEHLLASSSPTRTSTAGRPTPSADARARRTCSTGGSSRAARHGRTRSPTRSTASTRCTAPTGARRVRRRPLELVRAPQPARGSGRLATRRAHATLHECLVDDDAAARAVLPVPRRRDLHSRSPASSRCTCRLARGRRRSDPTLADRDGTRRAGSSSLGRAARSRGQGQGAPAAAPSAAAAPGRRARPTTRAPRSPTSST